LVFCERDRAAARRAVNERRIAHYRVERGRPVRSYTLNEHGALVDVAAR
jgi:hypothetical protein